MNLLEHLGIPMDRLLSTRRVAQILGVERDTVLEWRKQGRLKQALRMPDNSYRFDPHDVLAFLDRYGSLRTNRDRHTADARKIVVAEDIINAAVRKVVR